MDDLTLHQFLNNDKIHVADIEIRHNGKLGDGTPLDPTFVLRIDDMANSHVLGISVEVSGDWLAEGIFDEWPKSDNSYWTREEIGAKLDEGYAPVKDETPGVYWRALKAYVEEADHEGGNAIPATWADFLTDFALARPFYETATEDESK